MAKQIISWQTSNPFHKLLGMNSIPQLTDDTDFQQMPSGMEIHFFAYVFFFFLS